MDVYEKEKVGKLIHWGSDHFVYDYGPDEVIKFSLFDFIDGDYAKALQDYEICHSSFQNHILDTQFMCSPKNSKRIGKVQPKITGHYLSQKDLSDDHIRTQFFEEIVPAYRQMERAGGPLIDLIGQQGVYRRCMSNIFVTTDGHLKIIDTTLIGTDGLHSNLLKAFFSFVRPVLIWRQNYLIKNFSK